MSMPRLAACLFLALAAVCARAELKVGFAERDITPEVGLEVPGGYGKSFSKVITDPCKVRASVFDDGKRRVALVGLDTLIVPRDLVLAARRGPRSSMTASVGWRWSDSTPSSCRATSCSPPVGRSSPAAGSPT